MEQEPIEERRLRQEALLKEYEMCQQEATSRATSIWASTAIFLGAWITALGVIAATEVGRELVWIVAVLAVLAQFLWMAFLRRSIWIQQLMFVRQRQIEDQVGMLKSTAITLADEHDEWPQTCKRAKLKQLLENWGEKKRAALEDYFNRVEQEIRPRLLEKVFLRPSYKFLFACWLGREGRGALYALSISVAVAWLVFAGWVQWGQ